MWRKTHTRPFSREQGSVQLGNLQACSPTEGGGGGGKDPKPSMFDPEGNIMAKSTKKS